MASIIYHHTPAGTPTRRLALEKADWRSMKEARGLVQTIWEKHAWAMEEEELDELVKKAEKPVWKCPQTSCGIRMQRDVVGLSRSTISLSETSSGETYTETHEKARADSRQIMLAMFWAVGASAGKTKEKLLGQIRQENNPGNGRRRSGRGRNSEESTSEATASWENMSVEEARQILHVKEGADSRSITEDLINRQWRKALKKLHPDMGGKPEQAATSIQTISLAREILLDELDNTESNEVEGGDVDGGDDD